MAPALRAVAVVPTIGRPSIGALAEQLVASAGRTTDLDLTAVVFVDDRPDPQPALDSAFAHLPTSGSTAVRIVRAGGRGPAGARNIGAVEARGLGAEWIVFLDDDMVVTADWTRQLERELVTAPHDAGAVQGRIRMPRTAGRMSDWEHRMAGMTDARWLTGDIAYRTEAFFGVGGFDERFRRNYREDSDLAIRVRRAGWSLHLGRRVTDQQVVPEPSRWWSLPAQSGNRYDALMRRMHGRAWRAEAETPRGRRRQHLTIVVTAIGALAMRPVHKALSVSLGVVFATSLAQWTAWRLRRSRLTPRDIVTQIVTSVIIPFLAVAHWCLGVWAYRRAEPWGRISPLAAPPSRDRP